MDVSRRRFLRSFLAAPAVVAASSIMPVKLFVADPFPGLYPIKKRPIFPHQEDMLRWVFSYKDIPFSDFLVTPQPSRLYRFGQTVMKPTIVEVPIKDMRLPQLMTEGS